MRRNGVYIMQNHRLVLGLTAIVTLVVGVSFLGLLYSLVGATQRNAEDAASLRVLAEFHIQLCRRNHVPLARYRSEVQNLQEKNPLLRGVKKYYSLVEEGSLGAANQ